MIGRIAKKKKERICSYYFKYHNSCQNIVIINSKYNIGLNGWVLRTLQTESQIPMNTDCFQQMKNYDNPTCLDSEIHMNTFLFWIILGSHNLRHHLQPCPVSSSNSILVHLKIVDAHIKDNFILHPGNHWSQHLANISFQSVCVTLDLTA